ncbi:hypothetical protein B7463_g938, partial [Scytalidium lignicola]
MNKQVYEKFTKEQVTEDMLKDASRLFSENYGVWGSRVRLSKDRLRAQYLPENTTCYYARVTVDGYLAGNAFACRWAYNDKSVLWVTQLVVDRDYRERGLAIGLLNQLRQDDADIYGLMSSHPAACLAAAKAFGSSINTIQLKFIGDHAKDVMGSSPIDYVRDAKCYGSVFDLGDTSGLVSSVDTGFFVDHTEPLEALEWVQQESELSWPLGELLDGYEFLLILKARRRARSRSRSKQAC